MEQKDWAYDGKRNVESYEYGFLDIDGNYPDSYDVLTETMLKYDENPRKLNALDEDMHGWKGLIVKNRRAGYLDIGELAWIVDNYLMPQYELENRDMRAYQNYLNTVHEIREKCNADMQKRHPGYIPTENGIDKEHQEDMLYRRKIDYGLEEFMDKKEMTSSPAEYIKGKTEENKNIAEILQRVAEHNLSLLTEEERKSEIYYEK